MPTQDAIALYNAGLYGRALANLDKVRAHRELFVDELVCHTELLSLTGAVQQAIAAANKLKKDRRLTAIQRCRLSDVLGLSLFRLGQIANAIGEYERGIDLAEKSNELREESRLRVHLFRSQVRWCGPQKAAADLAQLRRKIN